MSKLFKSIFLVSFLLFFCFTFVFAEDITITTYYPSPYGVYNELQLYPHTSAVTPCDAAHIGTMYYNSGDNKIWVCGAGSVWRSITPV